MDIKEFLDNDKKGHKERSRAEVEKHLDEGNSLTVAEREDYFMGISTMFPAMMLGHYYEFKTGNAPDGYMNEFVPRVEKKYMGINRPLLDTVYENYGDGSVLAAFLGAYLSYYPVRILSDFADYAFLDDEKKKAEEFMDDYRTKELPGLVKRAAKECADKESKKDLILYLTTEYPFELLGKFHDRISG